MRKTIAIFLLRALSLFSGAISAGAAENMMAQLTIPWDQILDQGNHGKILFGVNILGPSPYSRNPGTTFKPASTSKLFTAASALSRLGPEFRFKTLLQWKNTVTQSPGVITGLTLIGGGDPTWGLEEFGEKLRSRIDQLAIELKHRGVTEIRGPIVVKPEDARWSQPRFPEGWEQEDHFHCGGALAQGFNLQGNCATFTITGRSSGHWGEYGVAVPVTLKIRSGTTNEVYVVETAEGYEFHGKMRKTRLARPVSFSLPVKNTEAWVRNLFLRSLSEQGIRIREDRSTSDQGATETLALESPTLAEILKPFLKNSFNFLGDAIFKIVGRRAGPESVDLVTAGQAALRDFVAEIGASTALFHGLEPIPGFYTEQVTLWDGSGLSRQSQVTTTSLITLLEDVKHRAEFGALWDALPIAGVDGTLVGRMKNTAAEGVLRAKTGTLRGVYNLSGYVPRFDKNGGIEDFIPFVVLTETTADQKEAARATEDRVGATLAKAVNP